MRRSDREARVIDLATAIDLLDRALEENNVRAKVMRRRIRWIRSQMEQANTIAELVQSETPPLIVELLTESIQVLHDASASFRQAEARLLHAEGLTMDQIAELFGVTRQRISSLLKAGDAAPARQRRARLGSAGASPT